MQPTTIPANDVLFQHTSRPDWGLAIIAWHHGDKRGYQFEDGQLRVFKNGYFKLLEPVDRPIDESARVLAALGKSIGRERAAKRLGADHPTIALDDQIAYFRSLFPEGFQGAAWAKKHRGIDARSELKRHRNPVMQRAAELLDPKRLEAHLETGRADVIIGDLRNLIASTDLVTKAAAHGMDRIDSVAAERLVRALSTLLTDESDVTTSFDAWIGALKRALDRAPTWRLATAFPALARTDRFTAVKRTTHTYAAAWLAPNLIIEQPSGRVYQRLLDMTDSLTTKLHEAGLRPRDRMDVYDFLQLTLSPKAIDAIVANTKDAAPATPDRPLEAPQPQTTDHAAA